MRRASLCCSVTISFTKSSRSGRRWHGWAVGSLLAARPQLAPTPPPENVDAAAPCLRGLSFSPTRSLG